MEQIVLSPKTKKVELINLIHELQSSLTEKDASIAALRKAFENQTQNNTDLQRTNDLLKEDYDALQIQVNAQKSTISDYAKALDRNDKENENLKNELNDALNDVHKYRKSCELAVKNNNELNALNKSIIEDNNNFIAKFKAMEKTMYGWMITAVTLAGILLVIAIFAF